MATQLKPTFAQLVLQKRDELANDLANQQAGNPRLSWIYQAQVAKLPKLLQNDTILKEQMLAELAERSSSVDFLETLRRAYEAGSEEATNMVLSIGKMMESFYADLAQESLITDKPTFQPQMTALAQNLEAYNQLLNQNLKTFDKNENEEITFENKQQLNENAPDPSAQMIQNKAENRNTQEQQFNPKPKFGNAGKNLELIEKYAAAKKLAQVFEQKAAEVGMQLSRRA
jgi:hypothetical protein